MEPFTCPRCELQIVGGTTEQADRCEFCRVRMMAFAQGRRPPLRPSDRFPAGRRVTSRDGTQRIPSSPSSPN